MIELMIVMVIVAVLTSLAVPAYLGRAKVARRAQGQAALAALAVAMERYYAEQSPSTYVGASLGSGTNDIFPNEAPINREGKFYDLSVTVPDPNDANGFVISAAPKNEQASDECGTLTLNASGVRGAATSDCWK